MSSHLTVSRIADAAKVVRCYCCGAKKVRTSVHRNGRRVKGETEPTIFHKPGCKLAETNNRKTGKTFAEEQYPGIAHGGFVCASIFGN